MLHESAYTRSMKAFCAASYQIARACRARGEANMPTTPAQAAALDAWRAGKTLRITAVPGAGKTYVRA